MEHKLTKIAAIVGAVVAQPTFAASMTVTGEITSHQPKVSVSAPGPFYEGVKEVKVMLAATHDGCRVLNYNSANPPAGTLGCYLQINNADLPVGMVFDKDDPSLKGFTAQKGAKSVPYQLVYRNGSAETPEVITSGFLPFNVEPTVPPVITKFQHQFDEPGWVDGNDPLIHKRQNAGAVKVTLEKRPYDQRVNIDGFSTCLVKEGADNCVASNSAMTHVRGTDDVGAKPMAVDVNSTNNYFVPVVNQVALSWDFRPPQVGKIQQGNMESPLDTIETVSGTQDVLYSTIAVLVNSVHNEAGKTWWQPSNLRMVLTPDPATPRKVILSYKGKTLLSLANTTHDNTTYSAKPVGPFKVTGPAQFRYDFDLNTIKDGDFLATMEASDGYGNTSTSETALPLRLDRYGPQVGVYDTELSLLGENTVLFFPEHLTVAAHNGYAGGVTEVTAKLGDVTLPLSPTDTEGVFTVGKTDLSTLQAGTAYPLVISAKDKAGRVTSKTTMVQYAATDLVLTASPSKPVQFVQRTSVKVETSGYHSPMTFDEEQARISASTTGSITCFAEWDLPSGLTPAVSVVGKIKLEGFIDDSDGIVGYDLYAISAEGYKRKVRSGTADLQPQKAAEPKISFTGRRKQGEDGLMVDINGGVAGTALVLSSPGDVEIGVNIPGLVESDSTVAMRARSDGLSRFSQIIKVPKGDIWTVYPMTVTAKYARTDEFKVIKEGKIYVVPNKRMKINLTGLSNEIADNAPTEVTAKVGIFDSKTDQINYIAKEHGQWDMRLVQELTTFEKGKGATKKIIELTDKVRTDANGEVKLNFDPSKTVGRSITYMIVGDVISPFEHFNLKIQSRKQHLMLIKGVGVDGKPDVLSIVDQVPMKATVRVSTETDQDKKALGDIEWQIRDGDSGSWRPAPNALSKAAYSFETEEPGKWQVRAVLHNRITGVEQPTDITTIVAYDKPEIQISQDSVVLKGQPVKLTLQGARGADLDQAMNVQWSADGKNWEDGDITAELTPVADSKYLYARAEFAASDDDADASSWVTTKFMPRVLTPQVIRASVEGPSKAETNKPFTLKGNYKNDYLLVKDVKFVEEWVMPDGTIATGNTVSYTPTEVGTDKLTFLYRVWVDGQKDLTLKEVDKAVETWTYAFPRFTSGQRQAFRMAPTQIHVRNTTRLPTYPGVQYTVTVEPDAGINEVSFDPVKGDWVGSVAEPGLHTVKITLSDNRGNSESHDHMFAVDEAVPMQVKLTPSYSNKFMRSPMSVNMSSGVLLDHPDDELTEIKWAIDGHEVEMPMRRQVFTGITAGNHTITFDALSELGQRAHVTHDFTVVPNTPAECKLVPSSTTTSWRVTMNCEDPDGRVVAYRWKINGELITNTSYAIAMTKALNPGVLDIEAVAVDDSGDESKASITLTGG